MDAADEVADLLEGGLGLLVGLADQRLGRLGVGRRASPGPRRGPAARATRRCWAPSCRSRSMRRRSASALSTAALRLAFGPAQQLGHLGLGGAAEQPPRLGRPGGGSTADGGPRGDDDQARRTPTSGEADGAGPGPDLEQPELGGAAGQAADVERQGEQGERPGPQRAGDDLAGQRHREQEQAVEDLPPARPGADPLPEAPEPVGGPAAAAPGPPSRCRAGRRPGCGRSPPSTRAAMNSSQAVGTANTRVISSENGDRPAA